MGFTTTKCPCCGYSFNFPDNVTQMECPACGNVIQDSAIRSMVSTEIISDSIATYKKYGSSVAAVPCVEVVFISDNMSPSKETINRNRLLRTQTPHTYMFKELYDAHLEAQKRGITNTAASCELMKELGKESFFSKGSEENIKITTRDDLKIYKALLHTKQDEWIK